MWTRALRGVVASLSVLENFSGIRAKNVIERVNGLSAQFVPVANEQRALELAGISDALEQVGRNEGFACAGGEGKQSAVLATGNVFEDGSDSCVLVIEAAVVDSGIWRVNERPVALLKFFRCFVGIGDLGLTDSLGKLAGQRFEAGSRFGYDVLAKEEAKLLEDLDDLAAIAERRDEPAIPHEQFGYRSDTSS